MKKCYGQRIGIAFGIILFWGMGCIGAMAQTVVTASISTYDYQPNLDWGIGYDYWLLEAPRDTNYVGLSEAQKESLQKNPEAWRKGILRIDVSPKWIPDFGTAFFEKNFVTDDTPEYLVYAKNQQIGNVRIENSDDIGIYPKWSLYVNAMDWWLDTIEGRNAYWQGQYKEDSRQWLLEVLIHVGDKSDSEVEAAIHSARLYFDILLAVDDTHVEQKSVCVETGKALRDTRYTQGGFDVWIEEVKERAFTEFFQERIAENASCISLIPEATIEEIKQSPGKYKLYELVSKCKKEMPWGVGALRFSLQEEGAWVFYDEDHDDFLCENDVWENGKEEHIQGMMLLIKSENESKEEREARILNLPLQCEFSTEFVGETWWDGEERTAEPYMRFSVGVKVRGAAFK